MNKLEYIKKQLRDFRDGEDLSNSSYNRIDLALDELEQVEYTSDISEDYVRCWISNTIKDDISNGFLEAKLDKSQINEFTDIIVNDDHLWSVISDEFSSIYEDLNNGVYPIIFSPINIENN